MNTEKLSVNFSDGPVPQGNIPSNNFDFSITDVVNYRGVANEIFTVSIYVTFEWKPCIMMAFTDAISINWGNSKWSFTNNSLTSKLNNKLSIQITCLYPDLIICNQIKGNSVRKIIISNVAAAGMFLFYTVLNWLKNVSYI